MLNSTIVANINNTLPINKQVASASRTSTLISRIDFAVTEHQTLSTAPIDHHKYLQKFGGKGSGSTMFNGQVKGLSSLDQNSNPQAKHNLLVNGNRDRSNTNTMEDAIPAPRIRIYSGKIALEWRQPHKIGAGLSNLGNTCFMNTVIQCLTYCPPLANYLLHETNHLSKCKIAGFCMMCELQQHMRRAIDKPGDVIKPIHIYQKLKSISKNFQFGRQEDAHEFLRYVIDNLWKSCLSNYDGFSKLDPASKETTVINQIFGGYHRSQVTCFRCKEKSNTYDHFMDFILDIKQNVLTLEKALDKFIQPEVLENENAYKCPQCNRKVTAQKKFSVYKLPNVATFQFKRFDFHRTYGGKITKHVHYPENLNMRPYMSDNKGPHMWYRLNAVLVHLGASCNSGHYFCYVKNSNGYWYLMDDSKVQQVSLNQVLNQNAYVLFYVRVTSAETMQVKRPVENSTLNLKNNQYIKNGFIGSSRNETSSAMVPRPCLSLKSSPVPGMSKLSVSTPTASLPNVNRNNVNQKHALQPLPQNREKVLFGIQLCGNKLNRVQNAIASNPQSNTNKLISPVTKSINENLLVPYIGDSSESSDDDEKNETNDVASKNGSSSPLVLNSQTSLVRQGTSEVKMHTHSTPIIMKDGCKNCIKTFSVNGNAKVVTSTNGIQRKAKVSNGVFNLNRSHDSSYSSSASHSSSKGKSSFPWHVTDTSLHSPSIASESSTNSVNSTTDWNVAEKDSNTRKKSERNYSGWNVHPRNIEKSHKKARKESLSKYEEPKSNENVSITELDTKEVIDVEEESLNAYRINNSEKQTSNRCKFDESREEDPIMTFEPNINNTNCLYESSGDGVKKKGTEESPLLPSPVKEHRDTLSSNSEVRTATNFPTTQQDSFRDQNILEKNQKSFLKNRQSPFRGDNGKRDVEAQKQSSIKRYNSDIAKNPCEERSSRFLDNYEDSDSTMSKKFKASHIRQDEREYQDTIVIGSPNKSSPNKSSPSKISPNKSRGMSTDSNSHFESPGSRSKFSRHSTDTDMQHKKQIYSNGVCENASMPNARTVSQMPNRDSESSSDISEVENPSSRSSPEFEWVEKTKETIDQKQKSDLRVASEKNFDSGKKDVLKKGTQERKFTGSQWDDNHKPDVIVELQRNSHSIYGTNVGSWQNETKANQSSAPDHHRKRYFDDYDEELDMGKVRKRKHHFNQNKYRHNRFQDMQNMRNRFKSQDHDDKWESDRHYHGKQSRFQPYRRHDSNHHTHGSQFPKHQHKRYKSWYRH